MRPEYRPDIDGLRAIAVLSVVLFHAGVGVVSGGYVGVDVFFVISGYLITTIISREIADNQFSIITFYERRFRRILPAAFAVTVTFLIAGFYFLDYVSFKEYAGSLIANNFFLSNFFFYQHAGYFEGPSELKPLLHTWSLAVEEQYYLFFPVLMLFIAKRMKGRCLQMLAVLTLCSLAAAEVGMSLDKSAVFYMLPTRAWELLAGSILAVASLPGVKSVRLLNAIAGLGFGMMAASIVGYDEQTEFPGISALVPVLGAVLVIYAGGMGKTVITRLLSARWLVFVGLISYSLYLWHWPVMAFSRYYFPEGPDAFVRAEMLGVIFILAVVTWRFVETPFRGKKLLGGKRPLFIASFSGSAVLVLLCGLVVLGNGFPQRGNIKQSQDVLAGDPEWSRWKDCESRVRELEENESACSIGSNNVEDSFMLWGDSHARALASAVHASATRRKASGVVATRTACPPLYGVDRVGRVSCNEFNEDVLNYLAEHDNIKFVILASRWGLSAKGTRYKTEAGDEVRLVDLSGEAPDVTADNVEIFRRGLNRMVEVLISMGKKVVLVKPIPEVGYDVPAAQYRAIIADRDVNSLVAPSIEDYYRRNEEVFAAFSEVQYNYPVSIVDPTSLLCNEEFCRVTRDDGVALYRDEDHLSTSGAKYVSSSFDTVFRSRGYRR